MNTVQHKPQAKIWKRALFVLGLTALLLSLTLLSACGWDARRTPHKKATPYQPKVSTKIRQTRYRVNKGDTLYSIAWRAGLDFHDVAKINGIRPPYTIFPGQILHLSKRKTKRSSQVKARTEKPKPNVSTPPRQAVPKTTSPTPKPTKIIAQPKKQQSSVTGWIWPTSGEIIRKFRTSDEALQGIHLKGQLDQPIYAAESGKVVYSGSGLRAYGALIILKHNENYLSAYGFNHKLLVKEGDRVTKGTKIATMGTSRKGVPTLHFEIRRQGKAINPLRLLPRQ